MPISVDMRKCWPPVEVTSVWKRGGCGGGGGSGEGKALTRM